MEIRLEHANLSVRDIDGMIRFLTAAFPEFRVRGQGLSRDGARWVHLGTDETYLALNQSTRELDQSFVPYEGLPGVNHLAYEVEDVEAVRRRLKAAGYRDSTVPNAHPYRRRVYFNDREGNDWEFIQYLSNDPLERHDYELPDSQSVAHATSRHDAPDVPKRVDATRRHKYRHVPRQPSVSE